VLFDAPDGTVGIEQRTTTTIAPQALLMMNNPVVRRSSTLLAGRMGPLSSPENVVRTGYLLTLGRPPSATELADSAAFLRDQQSSYVADKKSNADALALADFAQVLLELNEFVYVD
jgi:hypothetical protein